MPFIAAAIVPAIGFGLMNVGVGGFAAGVIAQGIGSVVLPLVGSIGLSYAASLLMPNANTSQGTGKKNRPSLGTGVPRCAIVGIVATAGHLVYDNVYGADKRQLQQVHCLADHECVEVQGVIVDGKRKNVVSYGQNGYDYRVQDYGSAGDTRFMLTFKTGLPDQTHFGPLAAHADPSTRWDSDHDLRNIAYVASKLEYRKKEFPSRQPPSMQWIVKGGKWYDPRLDLSLGGTHNWNNKNTWAYSCNPAVFLYNYLRGYFVNGKLWWGAGIPEDELDTDYFITAANACDVTVTNPDASTRKRYEVHMQVEGGRNTDHRKVMDACMKAMNGMWTIVDGKIRVFAGVVRAAVATITDDELMPGVNIRVSDKRGNGEGLYNEIHTSFTNAERTFEPKPLPIFRRDADILTDGQRLEMGLDLTMVNDRWQARQIQLQMYRASRLQYNADVGLKPEWTRLEPGDIITWNSTKYNFNKSFLITSWKLEMSETLYVQLALQEIDADVYAANADSFTLDAPENNTEPTDLAAPTGFTISAVNVTGTSGKSKQAIRAQWNSPDNQLIEAVLFETRLQSDVTQVFRERSEDVEGNGTTAFTLLRNGIGVDAVYQVRASFQDADNPQLRAWTSWTNVTLVSDDVSDNTPPDTPTGLALSVVPYTEAVSGQTVMGVAATWNAVTALDLDVYQVRYRFGSKPWTIVNSDDTDIEVEARENRTYTFQVRAKDKSGNKSDWSTAVTIAVTADTERPTAPITVTVKAKQMGNVVRWSKVNEPDVKQYGIFWDASALNAPALGDTPLEVVAATRFIHDDLPTSTPALYYWVCSIDASGNQSTWRRTVDPSSFGLVTNTDIAQRAIDTLQIVPQAVVKIDSYQADGFITADAIISKQVTRTAGTKLMVFASWYCDRVTGSSLTQTGEDALFNPIRILRSAVLKHSRRLSVPFYMNKSDDKVFKGEQSVLWVDNEDCSGNQTYRIEREWPGRVGYRYAVFIEFKR